MCVILETGVSYHRQIGSAVPVEIVAARRVARFFAVGGRNQSLGATRSAGLARPLVCTLGFSLRSGGNFSSPFGPLQPSALVDLLHGSCASCPYYQGVPESVFVSLRKKRPNPVLNSGPVPPAGNTFPLGYRPSCSHVPVLCLKGLKFYCTRISDYLLARSGSSLLGQVPAPFAILILRAALQNDEVSALRFAFLSWIGCCLYSQVTP